MLYNIQHRAMLFKIRHGTKCNFKHYTACSINKCHILYSIVDIVNSYIIEHGIQSNVLYFTAWDRGKYIII